MFGKFIRINRGAREILLNVGHIWKLEAYYVRVEGENGRVIPLKEGERDENAVRIFHAFIGNEEIKVKSRIGDPVTEVLEAIYKSAVG